MRLILLGPPGAGKGTQAEKLKTSLNVPHLSTGDMFRAAIKAKTHLGLAVKAIVDRGDLVSNEMVWGIVSEGLSGPDCANGFILDGFPRSLEQAEMLGSMLQEKGEGLDHVVQLTANEEELVERLLQRAKELGRKDDTEEVIRHRLKVYTEETAPLAAYYKEKGLLREIDGMGTIEQVASDVQTVLKG